MVDTKITRYLDKQGISYRILPHTEPVFTVESRFVFDKVISRCAKVNISSGDPMAGLELDASDLFRLSRASLGQIAALTE